MSDRTKALLHYRAARMLPVGVLINTARSDLIDGAALHAPLRRGHLLGAGLDVYRD